MSGASRDIITIESSDEEEGLAEKSIVHKLKPEIVPPSKRRLPVETESAVSKRMKRSESIKYIDPCIRLTTVQQASDADNVGCVSLESLLGDENLELMVQINFMIDVEFVMSKVPATIRDSLKTIVYHGLRLTPEQLRSMESRTQIKYPRVVLNRVSVPGIGTHHTKAMILFYRDGTMQFIVHTANMIERDWRNKTQAIFTTGRLSKKPLDAPVLATCAFERDLIEYLQQYSQHQEITSRIASFDFTGVRGVLVGSVPGKFSGSDRNKWGHLRLRAVLRQQVEISRECMQNSKIICQMSSIGSLGKDSQDWLRGEFETSLNAHRHSNYMMSKKAELCVVFPTAENVRTSWDGWSMGGSIPFKSTSYAKQAHYLNPILHSWKAFKSGRDRAMPHIKTFTRVSLQEGADVISWFLLTSANLSKPAWGEMRANNVLDIKSFELGVLVFPALYEDVHGSLTSSTSGTEPPSSSSSSDDDLAGGQVFMLNATVDHPQPKPPRPTTTRGKEEVETDEQTSGTTTVVPIRLPYDLPLKRYDFDWDQVWLTDKYFPGVDDFGATLSPD